jgi:hypothetical protein
MTERQAAIVIDASHGIFAVKPESEPGDQDVEDHDLTSG